MSLVSYTRAQAVQMWDSLQNFVSGLGTLKDPRSHTHFVFRELTRQQLENAYRSDWLARRIVDLPAEDATRQWRTWQTDPKKIKLIADVERDHAIQRKTRQALQKARLYGGAALILGVDQGEPEDELDLDAVGKGDLKFVQVLHRWELNGGPRIYNIASPWYSRPEYYTVATPTFGFYGEEGGSYPGSEVPVAGVTGRDPMGRFGASPPPADYGKPGFVQLKTNGPPPGDMRNKMAGSTPVYIHPSRVIEFVGNEMPDWRMQVMGAWGDSVLQTVDDTLRDFAMIVSGLASLVNDMKMDIVKVPGLTSKMATKELTKKTLERFSLSNQAKSSINTLLLDKEEDWERITTSFGSTPELIKVCMTLACGAGGIPESRVLGNAPNKGLAAEGSSGGEVDIHNYYDDISSQQESKYRPMMRPLDICVQATALGSYSEDVDYVWNPLYEPNAAELADIALKKAQATQVYFSMGLFNDQTIREAVSSQISEDDVYPGWDQAVEDNGLEPEEPEAPPQAMLPVPPPGLMNKGQFEPNPYHMMRAQNALKTGQPMRVPPNDPRRQLPAPQQPQVGKDAEFDDEELDDRWTPQVRAGALEARREKSFMLYHGSTHDFDHFDSRHIGGGQGNQSQGRGIYLAENPNIAKSYETAGEVGLGATYKGKTSVDLSKRSATYETIAAQKVMEHMHGGLSADAAIAKHAKEAKDQEEKKATLKLKPEHFSQGTHNLYKVRVHADPEHFIDFDKPLSGQSEHVRNALGQTGLMRGQHGTVGEMIQSHQQGRDAGHVTSALHQAGIEGIKYRAGQASGARYAGSNSHNWVVFDPKRLEVTHKNGVKLHSDSPTGDAEVEDFNPYHSHETGEFTTAEGAGFSEPEFGEEGYVGKGSLASLGPIEQAQGTAQKSAGLFSVQHHGETLSAPSKQTLVHKMLLHPEGATAAQVKAATGWPSVSMPQQAAAGGLQLSKSKKWVSGEGMTNVYKAVKAGQGAPLAAKAPAPLPQPSPGAAGQPAGAAGPPEPEVFTGWTKTGAQKGSNPGGFYKDPQGVGWYVKTPNSEGYARNEVLTGKLYALAGAKVPETKLVKSASGTVGVASKLIPAAMTLAQAKAGMPKWQQNDMVAEAKKDFAADAWLANWDVVGLENDNLMISYGGHGDVHRVDHGGGMEFRAQGQPKAQGLWTGANVNDWSTLRDPQIAPQAAAVFGDMTSADLAASASKVAAVKDADIKAAVESVYPAGSVKAQNLITTLRSRRDIIKAIGQSEANKATGTTIGAAEGTTWSPKAVAYLESKNQYPGEYNPNQIKALGTLAEPDWTQALQLHSEEVTAANLAPPAAPTTENGWSPTAAAYIKATGSDPDLYTPGEIEGLNNQDPNYKWGIAFKMHKEETGGAPAGSPAVGSDLQWSPKAKEYLSGQGKDIDDPFWTPKEIGEKVEKSAKGQGGGATPVWTQAYNLHQAELAGSSEGAAALLAATQAPKLPVTSVAYKKGEKLPASLNNVAFSKYAKPANWDADPGVDAEGAQFEPAISKTTGKTISAGLAMIEPDGRVWIRKPTGGYGGYTYSWPKGGQESGLSLQATALKEAHEETGLHGKVTGHIGDFLGGTTLTRMYLGTRIGGQPTDTDSETETVHLVTPQDAMGMFNTQRDKDILMAALKQASEMQGNTAAQKALDELKAAGHKVPTVGANGLMSKGSAPISPTPPAAAITPVGAKKKKTPATPTAVGAYTHGKTALQSLQAVDYGMSPSQANHAHTKAKAAGYDTLTKEEAAAIYSYTGGGSQAINPALYSNKLTADHVIYDKLVNSGLAKMPKYVGVTKRGVSLSDEKAKSYIPGHVMIDPGIWSTSPTKPWSGNVQFTIHSLTGVKVTKLSQHPGEDEVVIPSKTPFNVVSNDYSGGKYRIVLQEIPTVV